MLKSLAIHRFKSIRSQELELGRVNLFIGGNGSGKSNILEAIGVVSSALHRGITAADFSEKGIRQTPSELMKSAHKNAEIPRALELIASFDNNVTYKCNLTSKESDAHLKFDSESCKLNGKRQFGRSGNGQTIFGKAIPVELDKNRGLWDQLKVAYKFSNQVRSALDSFSTYSIYTPQADVLRGVIGGGTIYNGPVGLHGEGLPNAVRALVRNVNKPEDLFDGDEDKRQLLKKLSSQALDLVFLPGWTNQVEVGKIDENLVSHGIAQPSSDMVYFIDKFMKKGRNTLSAYDSSEGTLFLLFMAVLLAHTDSPTHFGLDNVDSALNPSLTRKLIESIIEISKLVKDNDFEVGPEQVFMTSHNPTSLDAFDLFDDDQRVFVVTRNKKGYTEVQRLKPSNDMTREGWQLAKGGKNLSQMWLDGMIAGANGYEEL